MLQCGGTNGRSNRDAKGPGFNRALVRIRLGDKLVRAELKKAMPGD
jgi:hypothetical protein